MVATELLTLLAVTAFLDTGSQDATLGITAIVVRPVEISRPQMDSDKPVLTIRNTEAIEVRAEGATVDRSGQDAIVRVDRSGSVAITLVF